MARSFDDLVNEANSVDVSGWDFSWLDGRATEQRPSWGYQRLLTERLAGVSAALDIQTGGGEVLAGIASFPAVMVATESWPPNAAVATQRLHPRGVVVVANRDEPPLPFVEAAFDLVSSRHPINIWWNEIARVLRPGGTYFAQHVGPRTNAELYQFFLGPHADTERGSVHHPDTETAAAQTAGLKVTQARMERLRVEFFDIGAIIYFLRKVIWTVPSFSVDRYHQRLRELHQLIQTEGRFISHSTRVLFEATKPSTSAN